MGAISARPDMLSVVDGDYRAYKVQASAAISRGTVLDLDTNGRAKAYPLSGNPTPCIGVALDTVAAYESVTCVFEGVVNVANADDTTAIAIGSAVKVGTYAGAVIATTTMSDTMIIGSVVEKAIAGNSYGKIMLKLR
jgi:hypothetical protein